MQWNFWGDQSLKYLDSFYPPAESFILLVSFDPLFLSLSLSASLCHSLSLFSSLSPLSLSLSLSLPLSVSISLSLSLSLSFCLCLCVSLSASRSLSLSQCVSFAVFLCPPPLSVPVSSLPPPPPPVLFRELTWAVAVIWKMFYIYVYCIPHRLCVCVLVSIRPDITVMIDWA